MWFYIKLLETFLLKTVFSKDEYNVNSKNFSPVKLAVIGFMLFCTVGFFFLLVQANDVYTSIKNHCPKLIDQVQENKTKEKG